MWTGPDPVWLRARYLHYLDLCVPGDDAMLLAQEDAEARALAELIAAQPPSNGGPTTTSAPQDGRGAC